MGSALGLVETRGLVGAIEAADAMLKAANVKFIGKEKVVPALITIKVIGEVAAVRAAVDAGAEAAKRVGQLVSVHIIPQPDEQLKIILPEIDTDTNEKKQLNLRSKPVSSDSVQKETLFEKSGKDQVKKEEIKKEISNEPEDLTKKKIEADKLETEKKDSQPSVSQSSSDTISRLRREALGIKEIEEKLKSESTSKVKKEETNEEDLKFENMSLAEVENLNVHKLRRLARSTNSFPIQGREISKANRKQLLYYFNQLK